jgi:uncharacterized coiled-coil DUF342 family protein
MSNLDFTMSNLDKEIRELWEKTNQNRRQFLETDLQTCFIAIERGQLELSLGNTHEAHKEFVMASNGADVIERFLRKAPGEMADLEAKLSDLRSSLESFRTELDNCDGESTLKVSKKPE